MPQSIACAHRAPRTAPAVARGIAAAVALVGVIVAVAVGGAVGCSNAARAPQPFLVRFQAATDHGVVLAGASVTVGESAVGHTGADGSLLATVHAEDGSVAPLAVDCPAGHHPAQVVDHIQFRTLDPLPGQRGQSVLRIDIACPRTHRTAALIVSTPGWSGLPVVVDGHQRAVTDAAGLAHLAFAIEPHTAFRVALDTTARPDLRPRSPETAFTVEQDDDVFAFESALAIAATPPRKPRRRRARRRPPPTRPIRIH